MLTRFISSIFASSLLLVACDTAPADDPNAQRIKTGDLYPDVTVFDCDGNPIVLRTWLAAHAASYVTFGAGWCTACQEEAPIINTQLVDGLAGRNAGVAQILLERQPGEAPPAALCAAWKRDLGARYDVFIDTEQANLAPFFGAAVDTLPLHLVATPDGTIRYLKRGEIPTDIKALLSGWLP